MARPKQPIEVVKAKGKKHLTRSEIEARENSEIKPIAENIIAPDYLDKTQVQEFYKIAEQLGKLKIMGETDVDALARYVVANDFYINTIKQMNKKGVKNDPELFDKWSRLQEKYFKQCRACANDLGLTIKSRVGLVVPVVEKEAPKTNKFAKFEKEVNNE